MSELAVDWNKNEIGRGHDFARFALLAGLLREHLYRGSVLDVGCDTGRLKQLIGELDYTGIDARPEAIEVGKALFPSSRFICARAEEWNPDQMFDAIVFNESLYYLNNFSAALDKFYACLQIGGLLAISIYKHPRWFSPNHQALKQSKRFIVGTSEKVHDIIVSSGGFSWNILVARKNSPCVAEVKEGLSQ
jgi:Trans-aconitate methyltransferase